MGSFYISLNSSSCDSDGITLKFQLREPSHLARSIASDQPNDPEITWKRKEIQDFIRRLGFSDLERANDSRKMFVELNEVCFSIQFCNNSLYI